MLPSRVKSHPHHVIRSHPAQELTPLKQAVVYGANASGKSNLIRGMRDAQKMVTNRTHIEQRLPFVPFALDAEMLNQPSRFEFEIQINQTNYAYGFSFNAQSIQEEWLYQINRKKEVKIFERQHPAQSNETDAFSFGALPYKNPNDEQFLAFVARGTAPNRLFLSECRERNVFSQLSYLEPLAAVSDWFHHQLRIIFPESTYKGALFDSISSSSDADADSDTNINPATAFTQSISDFIAAFDTGINKITAKAIDFEKDLSGVPESLKQGLAANLQNNRTVIFSAPNKMRYQLSRDHSGKLSASKIMTERRNSQGETVYFDIPQESHGTQRLLDIAPGICELLMGNKVYVIDEIDRSLHPELTKTLLSQFLSDSNSNLASQLVVTTHEIHLLNLDLLRRDEIWFTQKHDNGTTSLYSLEEYQPRFDKDIRKGYLAGRFGGVPDIAK